MSVFARAAAELLPLRSRARLSDDDRARYAFDIVAYGREVLGVTWWSAQQAIAEAVMRGEDVLAPASHGVGKTFLAAGAVNWHYDCFDPGLTLSTAPTRLQVEDALWKEIRLQRRDLSDLQPRAPRMESSPGHFAVGYTARDANAFQGRHSERIMVVFDEAVGVEGPFWDATEGILSGGDARFLGIYNPTDTTSRCYEEEISGRYTVIRISALDHPNIAAGLRGEPEPFPGAVSLDWVQDKVERWCSVVMGEPLADDIEFPPGSGLWYRPGPLFDSRVLGRWPTTGSTAVWTEGMWASCFGEPMPIDGPLQIGVDVARHGDDWTVIHARRGPCSVHHERHNGWELPQVARRVREVLVELGGMDRLKSVPICVDDDGIGGALVDTLRGDLNVIPVNAGSTAWRPNDYPNRRSELWFVTANMARERLLDFSRIGEQLTPDRRKALVANIRRQALAPMWSLDERGRRVVERKDETKKRLRKRNPDLEGGSPDDMDAINLAFSAVPNTQVISRIGKQRGRR